MGVSGVGRAVTGDFEAEAYARGVQYLYSVRALAIEPDLISIALDAELRLPICTAIGSQIHQLNAHLHSALQACHDCFHPWQRPQVQIFAAPFAPGFGIDGLCNLYVHPVSILVDVGRVVPQDWLSLVVHEYTHAILNSPGHSLEFALTLAHLCRALDLPHPPLDPVPHPLWPSCPPYRSTLDPLRFWLDLPLPPSLTR